MLIAINPRKYGLRAIKTAALSLALAVSFQVAAQNDKERVESIEVFGEKTTLQLKRAFDNQRFEFLELYNSINETAKFDVICKYEKPIGSQIARKLCEPRYMIDFRALTVQTWSTQPGIDFNRLPNDDTLRFLTKDTREEAYQHVAALVATNQKLLDRFMKLDALHERIKASEEGGMNGK